MNKQANQIISQIAVDTLEKLAFMFAFPDEPSSVETLQGTFDGSVAFSGPFSGKLVMRINPEDLAELAGNMLGVDDVQELTDDQRQDAMKETLNVLCGNILPVIAGTEAVFDIHPPQLDAVVDDAAAEGGATRVADVRLNMDEGVCGLSFYIDDPVPEGLFDADAPDGGS